MEMASCSVVGVIFLPDWTDGATGLISLLGSYKSS